MAGPEFKGLSSTDATHNQQASLQQLLRWGIANSDPDKLREAMESAGSGSGPGVNAEAFNKIMEQMEDDSKKILDRLEALGGSVYTEEEKEEIMEDLEELLNQVDNACDMIKFGFDPILRYARQTENRGMQWRALWALATCAQNNPEVQNHFVETGLLKEWITVLSNAASMNETVLSKVIGCISATVRDNNLAIAQFLEEGGVPAVLKFFVDSRITAETDVQAFLASSSFPLPAPSTLRTGTLDRTLFFFRHLLICERDAKLNALNVKIPESAGNVDLSVAAPAPAPVTAPAVPSASSQVPSNHVGSVDITSESNLLSSKSTSVPANATNETNETNEIPSSTEQVPASLAPKTLSLDAPTGNQKTGVFAGTTAGGASGSRQSSAASGGSSPVAVEVGGAPVALGKINLVKKMVAVDANGTTIAVSEEGAAGAPRFSSMEEYEAAMREKSGVASVPAQDKARAVAVDQSHLTPGAVYHAADASVFFHGLLRCLESATTNEDGEGAEDHGYDVDSKELAVEILAIVADLRVAFHE